MFSKKRDLLILVVRIIIGGIFVYAGWTKALDMANTVYFFNQLGFAAFLAYVVTYAELIFGVLVVLGIRLDISASILSIVMLVAAYASSSLGFQGMMTPIAILAGLLSLLASGPGSHAVRLRK